MPEIKIALTARQSEFDNAIESYANTLYGGARGGGKSHGLRNILLKRRFQYAGSIGTIFRKTWEEVRDNHLNPILEDYPVLRGHYVAMEKEIKLPNGSRLQFRHAKDFNALKKKQGLEFHDLAIDEAGDWPEEWFRFLKASNRSSKKHIKPRCMMSANPGGIGHKWLKRLFVTRQFKDRENPNDYKFVPATVQDNPFIMGSNPEYLQNLEAIPNEVLRRAWLLGDWDVKAGQFFDMVSRETHLIEPFAIPEYWETMGMFDTGYNHPAGFLWMASDTDGNNYIYREWCKPKYRTEQIVEEIGQFEDTFRLGDIVSGWDSWTKKGGGPSVAEKFLEASGGRLALTRENGDRVSGAIQVRDYLALREGKPRLYIFKTCEMLFDCLTRMTHDLKNPEDVLKQDAVDGDPWTGDELYDCLRMGLMNRPRISTEPPKPKRRSYYGDEDRPTIDWRLV